MGYYYTSMKPTHIWSQIGTKTSWPLLLFRLMLEQYISRKGSPLDNYFGLIDGTVLPISRPGTGKRVVYNGYKREHGLKFQSVTLPNIFEPVRIVYKGKWL